MIIPQHWGPINPSTVLRTIAIVALAALGIGIMYYLVKHTSLLGRAHPQSGAEIEKTREYLLGRANTQSGTGIEKTEEYKNLSEHVNAQCLDLIRMTPGILATQRAVIRDYKFFNPLIYLSPNPNVVLGFFFQISDPSKLDNVYQLIKGLQPHDMMQRLQSRDFLKIVNQYPLTTIEERDLANAVFDLLTGNDPDLHLGIINRVQGLPMSASDKLRLLNGIKAKAALFAPLARPYYQLKLATVIFCNPRVIHSDPVLRTMGIDTSQFNRATPAERLVLIQPRLTDAIARSVPTDPLPWVYDGTLIVNRQKLRTDPWWYIGAIFISPGAKIRFEQETGTDAGGLWRDFVTVTLESVMNDRAHFTRDLGTGKAYPIAGYAADDKFRLLGHFLKDIRDRKTLIGPIFDPRLYTAIGVLTRSELATVDPSEAILLKLAKSVWPNPVTRDLLFPIVEKGNVVWDETEAEIIEHNLWVNNYPAAVNTIYETASARALFAIAQGLGFVEKAEDLKLALEGDLDRKKVAGMIRYSGRNASIQQQVDWLKEWLQESEENCVQFLYFATGSKGLDPNLHSIPINPLDEADQAFNAHTCSQTVDFSTRITYASKEDFLLVLKTAIAGDRGFNNS